MDPAQLRPDPVVKEVYRDGPWLARWWPAVPCADGAPLPHSAGATRPAPLALISLPRPAPSALHSRRPASLSPSAGATPSSGGRRRRRGGGGRRGSERRGASSLPELVAPRPAALSRWRASWHQRRGLPTTRSGGASAFFLGFLTGDVVAAAAWYGLLRRRLCGGQRGLRLGAAFFIFFP